MRITLELNSDDLHELQLPVIVEQWDKVVPRTAPGRKRNAFSAEFSEKERRRLRVWYRTIYRWYLVKGFPQQQFIRIEDLNLLKRASYFFATV